MFFFLFSIYYYFYFLCVSCTFFAFLLSYFYFIIYFLLCLSLLSFFFFFFIFLFIYFVSIVTIYVYFLGISEFFVTLSSTGNRSINLVVIRVFHDISGHRTDTTRYRARRESVFFNKTVLQLLVDKANTNECHLHSLVV